MTDPLERSLRWNLSRRDFLTVAGIATGLIAVPGCDRNAPAAPAVFGSYFDLLREMQRRLRMSPDHVEGRLARFASAGDIAGLVDYVRRHFAVLPGDRRAWVSPFDVVRWGPRGAARSRAGTPRELAELVKETLRAAGHDAVPVGSQQRGAARPLLVNPEPLPFRPEGSPDDLEAATRPIPAPEAVPADPTLADEIATAALAALNAEGFRPVEVSELNAALPDVRIDGEVLGLWRAEPVSEPAPSTLRELGEMRAAPEARFTLSIATVRDPGRLVEVADAAFRLDELAGRRVDVGFVPPAASPLDLMAVRPAEILSVIPTIRVAGLGMSDEEQARLQIAGTPLTVEGEVLEEAEDGFGSRSGRVSGVNDPARAAEIRIRRIVASAFPRLGVEFDVLDADGEPVPDIGAEHFELREAGVATTHLFRHTDAPTPGVIFLVDKSTSMPSQYRDAGAERVIREIATRVQARWPAARFRTAIVGASGAGVLGWQTDPARVGAEANYFGMGSGLWHAYADAAEAEGTAIVFLTDGVAADENNVPQPTPPDALVARLRAAPPAIMLGTGALGPAFEGLAEITGGVTLDIADPDRAIGAVLEQLERHRGTYTALTVVPDDQAAGERQIQIALPATGVSATGPYRVPPLTERAAGDGVAGIYLRVQANGVSCTRTLAGVAFGSGETLAPDRFEEMQAALLGCYSVITEAGAPSPSQILDDLVSEALSWEGVLNAATADAALEALGAAHELPQGQFAFSVPVSTGGSLTWDTGLRMWLSTDRVVPQGERSVRRLSVDLLPVTRFATAAETAAESTETTARRSAGLAAYETAIYERTAAGQLTGELRDSVEAELDETAAAAFAKLSAGWPATTRFAVSAGGGSAAAVDRETGTLISVLSDGTGGGVTEAEIERDFKQIIALVEMSGSVGALSAWAKLEKAKLEKLRIATLIIHRMSVEGVIDLLASEACKKLGKEMQAGAMAGLRHADRFAADMGATAHEAVKDFNRWANAAGMPPGIPTDFKPC